MLDSDELLLLLLLLNFMSAELEEIIDSLESQLSAHIKEQRRLNRALPADKVRVRWSTFVEKISQDHFRKMFRMPLEGFSALCKKIEGRIGPEKFRSEDYLAHNSVTTKAPVPGEVRVALSISMLAGGSYLDLVPLFDVHASYLYASALRQKQRL